MSQEKYASDIEKKVGIETCKPVAAPLVLCEKLSGSMGELFEIEVCRIYGLGVLHHPYIRPTIGCPVTLTQQR